MLKICSFTHTKPIIMSTLIQNKNDFAKAEAKEWFKEQIENLKLDQLKLETGTASEHEENIYRDLIYGSSLDAHSRMRETASFELTKSMFLFFLQNVSKRQISVTVLAFGVTTEKIFVWAEVEDGDWESEKKLLLASAETNASFFEKTGIRIETTVVETSDNCKVPPHYFQIKKRSLPE